MPSVMSSADSNWSAKSVSFERGSRLASVRAMRTTSSARSLRLCAFSVLGAWMRKASVSSGETSAVICRSPSTFAAASRCRPFGVQKRPSWPCTTISGSRNARASSIFSARRFVWVGDRSRWNGVGWIAAIQPTPFQRDLSPTHTKRRAEKIDEARAFLDPLIVVQGHDGRFWTPNGRHRLAAAKVLGLRQITALVSPDETLAYRILALNTEKAHNLKDRALEVVRMARTLAKREPRSKETDFADQFESAELITLGIVYESTPRFSGGAYNSMLRKVDRFAAGTLATSLREREGFADRLLGIDVEVQKIIAALQARGFKSPYLRNYVVARINPVRFIKQKAGDKRPAMPIGQALTRMLASAKSFKVESVSNSDLAWVAVGAGGGD